METKAEQKAVTGEGNAPRVTGPMPKQSYYASMEYQRIKRNEEAKRLAEFGMFGCNFLETKRIVNKLLKRHGLTLKTHGSVKWSTDQVEVWIEEKA